MGQQEDRVNSGMYVIGVRVTPEGGWAIAAMGHLLTFKTLPRERQLWDAERKSDEDLSRQKFG